MNRETYNALPAEEKAAFQSHRKCGCGEPLVRDGHSTGDLHNICPMCNECPDCEDGE